MFPTISAKKIKNRKREGTVTVHETVIISMGTRFSQAQVLRLCPLSPWQVTFCSKWCFFPLTFERLQCCSHSALGRTAAVTVDTRPEELFIILSLQSALSSASEMWEAAYFNRKPPAMSPQTHKQPHAHIQRCIQTHRGYTISGQLQIKNLT